jgi:hypothetical protein
VKCFVSFVLSFLFFVLCHISPAQIGWKEGREAGHTGLSQHHDYKGDPSILLGRLDGVRGRSRYAQITSQPFSVVRKIPMRDCNEINKGRWSPRRDVWYLGRDSTLRDKVLRCTIRVETPQGRFLPRVALVRVRNESS